MQHASAHDMLQGQPARDGAAFSTLPSLPESARSFTEGMSGGRRQQLQVPRAQSQTLPQVLLCWRLARACGCP
jgi:ABC-type branched-subunit amino acid transport system ATPase component